MLAAGGSQANVHCGPAALASVAGPHAVTHARFRWSVPHPVQDRWVDVVIELVLGCSHDWPIPVIDDDPPRALADLTNAVVPEAPRSLAYAAAAAPLTLPSHGCTDAPSWPMTRGMTSQRAT